jgi:hypothetical protein
MSIEDDTLNLDTPFHIDCECGERTTISAGAAGAKINCSCGRILEVPGLQELRRRAGLSPYAVNTATKITLMVEAGKLPSETTCAACQKHTRSVLNVIAACEFIWITTEETYAYGVLVSERELSQHGRELIVPTPIIVCDNCQRKRFHLGWLESLHWSVALAIASAGLVLLVLFSLFTTGAICLAVAAALYLFPFWAESRRRAGIKQLLSRTPIYNKLLGEYPSAIVGIAEQITWSSAERGATTDRPRDERFFER